jgi:hypothetical protein
MTATHRKDSAIKHCTVTLKHENEEISVEIPHQNTKNQNQKRNALRRWQQERTLAQVQE